MSEATAAAPPAAEEGAAAPKPASPWPPLLAVIVLMPVVSWASANFLILPKLKATVAEQSTAAEGAKGGHGAEAAKGAHAAAKPAEKPAAKAEKGGHGGKEGKGLAESGGKFSYDFENIVVNLSGAMGTRYLKVSFTALSANAELKQIIEENKKQMLDVAIEVLGSRTMVDLEAGGAKNVVRNDLMANFNQALGSDLIEQIYFSEFVVQ